MKHSILILQPEEDFKLARWKWLSRHPKWMIPMLRVFIWRPIFLHRRTGYLYLNVLKLLTKSYDHEIHTFHILNFILSISCAMSFLPCLFDLNEIVQRTLYYDNNQYIMQSDGKNNYDSLVTMPEVINTKNMIWSFFNAIFIISFSKKVTE